MGKFDINDLIKDLGEPNDDAPKETEQGVDEKAEALRPPDLTGSGLGEEIGASRAARRADPARLRPDDGLTLICNPSEQSAFGHSEDLAETLHSREIITPEQLATFQRVKKQSPGKSEAQVLIEVGADETDVQQVVAELSGIPFVKIDTTDESSIDMRYLSRLTPEYCNASQILPLRKEGDTLVLGTTRPDDVFLLDEVARRLRVGSIAHVLITAQDIHAVLQSKTEAEAEEYDVDELLSDVEEDDVEVVEDADDDSDDGDAESSPVVRYVNHIIQTAIKEGASDIHIEPEEKSMKVRFRIDGVLFEMMTPPRKMHSALTSRIKIMANLDIAERRLPQDGRIRATVLGRKIDLRVSTVPTPKGEKTVMRILDNRAIKVPLDDLGFSEDTLTIWKGQISQPHGIILVTGPTGSGKTTTLYASLQQLDLRKMNVSTVEDPVEYNLNGITQIQTHEKIGMTFAAALRALLRQDPDVVMLGEIRDIETATIATQAAMTGHLVLSTLHTNDAPSSITRLINIGVECFLVAAAVNAVLAQRLVRRICPKCIESIPIDETLVPIMEAHGLALSEVKHGKGCSKCRETGYSGRNGLYEMLVLDDFMRDAVARNPNVTEFRRQCVERGMMTLREDGFQKVGKGLTTVEEVLRVTEATI